MGQDGTTAEETGATPVDAALAAELVAMTDEDRRLQQGASAGGEAYQSWAKDVGAQLAYRRVTTRNADRLGQILDEHGWPTTTLVGAEGARRAWLIAQHADRRLDLQRRALRLMADAVASRGGPRVGGPAGPRAACPIFRFGERVLVLPHPRGVALLGRYALQAF
ncbi:DUF6624 domain-containing protein [Actinoallomurus sp. NPDC050550]|uniref:DUF6624 domain-containing protein n=1 Tax=Actinoallomurus sp. NPDC050550 TaxID=3154937 RepID=UPI0033F8B250